MFYKISLPLHEASYFSPPQNLESACKPIVTKPKPKVEPPKDEGAKPEDQAAEGGGAAEGSGETKPETGEESKMDEDQAPAPNTEQSEEMDVDLD